MSARKFFEQLGYLFYIVSPSKTSFETVEEIPEYVIQVVPHFILLLALEQCLLLYKRKRIFRINDAFGSISQGLLLELSKLVTVSTQLVTYTYVYNNWRLVTLPWNSLWTWWFCFLGVDFAYYWLHRASHEINILWAAHQVHHSSEDYNLSTALRQSVLQKYCTWMFNLPLALAIPPSVFLVHSEFNLLFQFWIHTEAVTNLGPLEYVLNTASHHRVHHGRNRYCIDKNYAGTLIIWDRMFGTFQAEKEEVVYGLTHPINSFESLYIQLAHYIYIWKTLWETKGFYNKLSVIFKGPGWSPGTPWHGYIEDIPDVKAPVEKFDPQIPLWYKTYAFLHFCFCIAAYVGLARNKELLPASVLWTVVVYIVFSVSSLGMMFEGRFYVPWIELLRCFLYTTMDYYIFLPYTSAYELPAVQWWFLCFLRFVFVTSFVFWLQYCLRTITIKMYITKMKTE